MAPQARFFLKCRMHHGLVELSALMAAKAQIVTGRVKQMGLIRGMRIVTIDAFPALQGGMNPFFVYPDLFSLMTSHAELIALFFEQQLGKHPMPQMAVLAFLFLDDGMYIGHGKVFGFKIGMAVQALFLGKLAGCAHGRRHTGNNNR
jgi:hypothetical protein